MRLLIMLTVVAILGGCSDAAPAKRHYRNKAERIKDAEIAVGKTPVPRTYRLGNGELQVIEFPVKDESGWLDIQRCYVWRDAEYRQASLSCGPTLSTLSCSFPPNGRPLNCSRAWRSSIMAIRAV